MNFGGFLVALTIALTASLIAPGRSHDDDGSHFPVAKRHTDVCRSDRDEIGRLQAIRLDHCGKERVDRRRITRNADLLADEIRHHRD